MDERHQVVKVPQPVPVDQRGFLGSVSSIYINGVKVQSQRLIQHTGSAELTIEGKNLKDTLRLLHNGVEYTPLTSTENSVTFILGDNGTNRIYVNGEYSFGVQISGVIVPDFLPGSFYYGIVENLRPDANFVETHSDTTTCINYPTLLGEGRYFKMQILKEDSPSFDFTALKCVNGTMVTNESSSTGKNNVIVVGTTDLSRPSYITYQGFIIAVFNYQA